MEFPSRALALLVTFLRLLTKQIVEIELDLSFQDLVPLLTGMEEELTISQDYI